MSNEDLLKPFPTNLSQTGSQGTGKQSEALFIKQWESLGHEVYEPRADRGIDFVVVTGNGCRKTVQVTAATPNCNHENGFNVNKPISRIRTDVDILALLVNHDELITVNLPLIGEVKIPTCSGHEISPTWVSPILLIFALTIGLGEICIKSTPNLRMF